MTRIVGISGSLRHGSYNTALLRIVAGMLPEGVTLETASIREIPLYDGDVEAERGIPEAVARLKESIAASDALLIATPEYNNSIPGVVKNAVDWLSRPPRDIPRVFGGLPVGLIGATPGRGGTILAQAAWLPVLRALTTRPFFGRVIHISRAAETLSNGTAADDDTGARLGKFVRDFVAFVRSSPRPGQ